MRLRGQVVLAGCLLAAACAGPARQAQSQAAHEDAAREADAAARALFDAGEDDQAIARWQEAVRLDPDLHAAWVGLGHALVLRHRIEEAQSVVDRLIASWPEDPHSWIAKGWLHVEQHELEDAVTAFSRALQFDAASIEARRGRLEALLGMGECARAQQELDRLRRDARFAAERLSRRVRACSAAE